MRILVVNWQDRMNPQAGGAEIHLHETFGRLAKWGHEVAFLVSGFQGAPGRESVDDVEVHRTGGRMTFGLGAPAYFKGSLARRRYDVVVEDLNKVPVFTPLWTAGPLALLVHHLFGGTAFQEASLPVAAATWVLERPLPWVYRGLPVVAVSQSTAQDLRDRGVRWGEITVIPNGVDLGHYSPDSRVAEYSEPTLLYLGRLKRYKRIDLILRALARMKAEGLEARLRVVGKGDQERSLRRLGERLGLQANIDLLGYVGEEEKLDLLRRSWVHVLTSPKEGWGITNLEAAACGTPTVASDSPGLRDSVRDGETGILVPHGDVDALARALTRLLSHAEERHAMGRAARRFAEGYSWDRTAREMEDFLGNRVATQGSHR